MHYVLSSMGKPFTIGRIAGIPIQLHRSWFLIVAVVAFSLSTGVFPRYVPASGPVLHWAAGVAAALLLFASVLLHELAHSLVAIRRGIPVRSITLFLFGGVSQLDREPQRPQDAVAVAVVGPLASFALGLVCAPVAFLASRLGAPVIGVTFFYLAQVNVVLALFNLFPAFPLDGGHVVRGAWWWWTGSSERGMDVAMGAGHLFASMLVVSGGATALLAGSVSSLWLVLLGLYIGGAARAAARQLRIKRALEKVPVVDALGQDSDTLHAVPFDASLAAVETVVRCDKDAALPVVLGDDLVGMLDVGELDDVPADARRAIAVREVMRPVHAEQQVGPDVSLLEAIQRMSRHGFGRLIVVQGRQLLGVVTLPTLLRFADLKAASGV